MFNEINCPPTDLDPDKIRVGDRVSFQWPNMPRLFGKVWAILPCLNTTRYTVEVDDVVQLHDVWAADITKEVG